MRNPDLASLGYAFWPMRNPDLASLVAETVGDDKSGLRTLAAFLFWIKSGLRILAASEKVRNPDLLSLGYAKPRLAKSGLR